MTQENTIDFGPWLTNPFGERYFYSLNRNSFKEVRSDEVYRNFFGDDYFQENSFYLITGSDGGLLLKYLSRISLPRGCRILIIELPEMMDKLIDDSGQLNLPQGVLIATFQEMDSKLAEISVRDYIFSERATILKSLCVTDAILPDYQALFDLVRATFEEVLGLTRNNFEGRVFMVRQIQNLAENRVPVNHLKDAFSGKTCVVLAVGPSLDDVLEWVMENREKLVVLAVSRAAKRLLEVGLTPDIFFTVDPSDLSFDVSRELFNFSDQCLLVTGDHSSPALYGSWAGRSAYVGSLLPWPSEIDPENPVPAGPTITQTTISLATHLGFSRILLGGVDLCFSADGQMYGTSTQGREKGPQVGTIKDGVETNSGKQAETILAFKHAAMITEELAKTARAKGAEVINLSPNAVKMECVDFVRADDVDLSEESVDVPKVIAEFLPLDGPEERQGHYSKVLKELQRVVKELRQIKALAQDGIAANEGLFGRKGKTADYKYKKKMDKIEATLENKHAVLCRLIKHFGILQFLKVVRPQSVDWTDEEIEETGKNYYQAYKDTANTLIQLLESAISRVKCRQMEESPHADIPLLAEQWEKDKQFGRVEVWRRWHPEAFNRLNDSEKRCLDPLDSKFQRLMRREENLSADSQTKPFDVKEARSRAKRLFQRKDLRALEILGKAVEGKKQENEAEACLWLINGLRSELEGDYDASLEYYGRILEFGESSLLVDALARVVSVSAEKGDMEHLELALQCLVGLSPIYLPKYGDLLWVLGRHVDALDQYGDYLEVAPQDTAAWLKLGTYYMKLNVKEGAELALNHVLSQEPDNQTAKKLLADLIE